MSDRVKLFTYSAETLKQAMDAAKSVHGEEALIIKSREIRKKSPGQTGLYEVVIYAENSDANSNKEDNNNEGNNINNEDDGHKSDFKDSANSIAKRLEKISSEKRLRSKTNFETKIQETVAEIAKVTNITNRLNKDDIINKSSIKSPTSLSTSSPTFLEPKVSHNHKPNVTTTATSMFDRDAKMVEMQELQSIKAELTRMNDKMRLMQNMIWSAKDDSINIPQEFAEIYRICKNSAMKKEHLDELMRLSQDLMPLNMRENATTVRRYFREVLRKMIVCRSEALDKRKKIMMLVGPTGVGKTTTIAKLASRYSLFQKLKVGLITLDSYRIGAFEQLASYASRLKLSINSAESTDEFKQSLESLKFCDYILIDTLGSSQYDKQKLDDLKGYSNIDFNIDVSLVLAANTKYEDLKEIYEAFSILDIDTLIFSKLDETQGFGNLFSLLYEYKKPLSYFCTGQEVPEDLLLARSDYLADCIINGFRK